MEINKPKSIGFEIKELAILIKCAFDKQTLSEKDLKNENRARLTIMQSHIIGFIYLHENYQVTQSEIEKEFHRKRSTIANILKLMEKNDLITREHSKKDARIKLVTLTDKAISLHQKITENIHEFNDNLEKGLTDEEIQTFHNIMDKIKKNLKQL